MTTEPTPEMLSTMSPELNRELAEKLNEEMRSTVMPVTVFVGFEAVFGFCGNMLILYVFLFHYHKCNFKYFVLLLSFVDTTSTLTTLPGEIVTQTFWYVYPVPMVCKIKSFFNVFTVCGGAFGLMVIAIDRYRKVCRPLQWQIKPNHAIVLIAVLLSVSFIIAIPVAFYWGVHSYTTIYQQQNITVTVCELDAKYVNTDIPFRYSTATEGILSFVMFIMFILYIFICRKLLIVKLPGKKNANQAELSQNPCSSGDTFSGERDTGDSDGYDDELSGQGRSGDLQDTEDSTDIQSSDKGDVKNVSGKKSSEIPASKDSDVKVSLPPNTETKNATLTAAKISSALSTLKRRTRLASSRQSRKTKIRRKTLIMFILTALFIFTTILYLTCLSFIAKGVLESMTKAQRATYFFFFRLYFINHAINPILYGILDPKFRRVLKQTWQSWKNRILGRKPLHINSI